MIPAQQLVEHVKSLPTLSSAVARLSALLQDENAGPEDFERAIRFDPALTANVLRLANSPYFGVAKEISSVSEAVIHLGSRRVFELAVGAAFARVIPERIPGYDMRADGFWLHSVAVAILAEALAKEVGGAPPNMVFTAGLLHDIGKLALAAFLPHASPEVLQRLRQGGVSFKQAVRDALGTDHTEVGGLVARAWNLPGPIVAVVRYHHVPGDAPEEADQRLLDLVHLADCLAHTMGYGSDAGELARQSRGEVGRRLGLAVQKIERVASATLDEIQEMAALLTPGSDTRGPQ